ncbi:hypothetical protein LB507_011557 [Fusarium sp. FIESC RH6]|nr:hypothetical protein LB507_011557 [Fusarium sp. FIESC RH6]
MCETNSATSICNVPVEIYFARKRSGVCPKIHFCAEIHGSIIYHLLQQLRHENPATTITNDKGLMEFALGFCNLNCKPIACLIVPAFKSSIKYIWRKIVQFKMVYKVGGEWTFDRKYHFATHKAAGTWFKIALGRSLASKNGRLELSSKEKKNGKEMKRLQIKGPKKVYVQEERKGYVPGRDGGSSLS